jgi:hypothetical protein
MSFPPGPSYIPDVPLPDEDPDETNEGIERLDLRDALKRIAYPKNWPDPFGRDRGEVEHQLRAWMQSVAANALTNAGGYNYERKAKQ